MPDACPNCTAPIDPAAVVCPNCGMKIPGRTAPDSPVASTLPDVPIAPLSPAENQIPINHSLAVLAAFALPVLGTLVFGTLIAVIGFGVYKLVHTVKPKPAPTAPAVVVAPPVAKNITSPRTPAISTPPTRAPTSNKPTSKPSTPITAAPVTPPLPPTLTRLSATIVPVGGTLVLYGDHLKDVNQVMMISADGAKTVDAQIVQTTRTAVTVRVPEVPLPDDGLILAAVSPGGVAVMIDQHTGVTPWGTDGTLQFNVVHVLAGDSIKTYDRMVLIADARSDVSFGGSSVAFLADHVKLTRHGTYCKIFYVAPISLGDGVSRDGLIEVPAINVSNPTDIFRVKPAPTADQ